MARIEVRGFFLLDQLIEGMEGVCCISRLRVLRRNKFKQESAYYCVYVLVLLLLRGPGAPGEAQHRFYSGAVHCVLFYLTVYLQRGPGN